MISRGTLELWVGLFVAAGLAALTVLAFKVGNLGAADVTNGYMVTARFTNIGQLKVKAPVTMAGVRIGRVSAIRLDKNYNAIVTLDISGKYQLPDDSSAAILTSGLLGEQYISLQPGADDTYLKQGSEIKITQSALILEKLISQFLFNKASEGPK